VIYLTNYPHFAPKSGNYLLSQHSINILESMNSRKTHHYAYERTGDPRQNREPQAIAIARTKERKSWGLWFLAMLLLLLTLLANPLKAQGSSSALTNAGALAGTSADSLLRDSVPVAEQNRQAQDLDTTANNLLEGVDILGDNNIATMYILWDSFQDFDIQIKEQIDTRNLAMDEFFMQNIDREEFEQERMLQLFEDRKKQYIHLFGENLEDLISEEESSN